MINVMAVASYIYNSYFLLKGEKIDEMKLHKMLYLVQRESLVEEGRLLFDATFYGWKYGPVVKEVREAYKQDAFLRNDEIDEDVIAKIKPFVDKILREYADKDSWSLSRLSHGEISWQNARRGIPEGENGDKPMDNEDIAKDAERIRLRRSWLDALGKL